jgi:hypothetical protein
VREAAWRRIISALEAWACLYRQSSHVEGQAKASVWIFCCVYGRAICLPPLDAYHKTSLMRIPSPLSKGISLHVGPHAVWLTRNTASNLIHAARRVCFGFFILAHAEVVLPALCVSSLFTFFGATALIHATTNMQVYSEFGIRRLAGWIRT